MPVRTPDGTCCSTYTSLSIKLDFFLLIELPTEIDKVKIRALEPCKARDFMIERKYLKPEHKINLHVEHDIDRHHQDHEHEEK